MLHNPTWDKATTLFVLSNFIAWLETMPADGTYNYLSARCAIGEYLEAHGSSYSEAHKIRPEGFDTLCDWNANITSGYGRSQERTYGAALQRARLYQETQKGKV